jgi:hypothetical protein
MGKKSVPAIGLRLYRALAAKSMRIDPVVTLKQE